MNKMYVQFLNIKHELKPWALVLYLILCCAEVLLIFGIFDEMAPDAPHGVPALATIVTCIVTCIVFMNKPFLKTRVRQLFVIDPLDYEDRGEKEMAFLSRNYKILDKYIAKNDFNEELIFVTVEHYI